MSQDPFARFRDLLFHDGGLGFSLDPSLMGVDRERLASFEEPMGRAFAAMDGLEAGGIANPDEGRQVGHYWLRAPHLAPDPAQRAAIEGTIEKVKTFADQVHSGARAPRGARRFTHVLVIGIGGSALGPQLVSDALGPLPAPCQVAFIDNTDPDGIDRTLKRLAGHLDTTLVLSVSKSGTTPETRNATFEVRQALEARGRVFAEHAVAVTGEDSALARQAEEESWVGMFPMWDWVGGRTSELSAVGLLPAALEGIDVDGLLDGAAAMDALTRRHSLLSNPAALLAACWHVATDGRGSKHMVVLPYKDRLQLFPRYLQQLVMESLGKAEDLDGNIVHQGLTVFGNKGSTDQHAFVQQLRDGIPDFFVTFIEVLKDRNRGSVPVEDVFTSGDFLSGFLQGTRRALHRNGRASLTLTIPEVSPRTVGALIALFERAVGLYASLVNVNAYHQPGVEAGKVAARGVLEIEAALLRALASTKEALTLEELTRKAQVADLETAFLTMRHLAANRPTILTQGDPATPLEVAYLWREPPA